jgi:hypothetical protein
MMDDRLAERLAQTRTMQEGFEKLRAYPTIGDGHDDVGLQPTA